MFPGCVRDEIATPAMRKLVGDHVNIFTVLVVLSQPRGHIYDGTFVVRMWLGLHHHISRELRAPGRGDSNMAIQS